MVTTSSYSKRSGIFYQTSEAGFCSLFNNFFYTYLYVKQKNQKLYVLDKPNPIGLNYTLFKLLLNQNKKNIEYVSSPVKGVSEVSRKELIYFLTTCSVNFLREEAKKFFIWSDIFNKKINKYLQIINETSFDIGIHMRAGDKITTGEMKEISIESYIDKVNSIKKTDPTIFIMSDTLSLINKFVEKAPKTWKVLYFNTAILSTHVQQNFNMKSTSEKEEAFVQFLAELECMKNSKEIICTFSSNVSRFLYLVHPGNSNIFHSLDIEYSAF